MLSSISSYQIYSPVCGGGDSAKPGSMLSPYTPNSRTCLNATATLGLVQVQQMEEQLEALQQEHHRLNEAHRDLEKQNKLLQEECNQLQVRIAAPTVVMSLLSEWLRFVLAVVYQTSYPLSRLSSS